MKYFWTKFTKNFLKLSNNLFVRKVSSLFRLISSVWKHWPKKITLGWNFKWFFFFRKNCQDFQESDINQNKWEGIHWLHFLLLLLIWQFSCDFCAKYFLSLIICFWRTIPLLVKNLTMEKKRFLVQFLLKMYTYINFTLLFSSYDKNNFHKRLRLCEGGTILRPVSGV